MHVDEVGVAHGFDLDRAFGDPGVFVDVGDPVGHEQSKDEAADPGAEFCGSFFADEGEDADAEGDGSGFPEAEDSGRLVFHHGACEGVDLVHACVGDIEDGEVEVDHGHCGDEGDEGDDPERAVLEGTHKARWEGGFDGRGHVVTSGNRIRGICRIVGSPV